MSSSENFQNFTLWKIFHDCVQPSNVAITPPEDTQRINKKSRVTYTSVITTRMGLS